MTDASLLYICSIKQHKRTLSEGGLMKFSIVLLVLVLGKGSRANRNFFDHSAPGIHPPLETSFSPAEKFFLTYF